jgi:outer membrane protein TolC
VPIFNGLKTMNKIKQANIALQQTQLQALQLTEQINLEITNAKITLTETETAWQIAKQSVPSAERSLILITSRWQKGVAKYSEVVDAELLLTQIKNNELKSIYDYLMAQAALLKALGK